MTEPVARTLWRHYETIHDLAYFSPQSRQAADAIGMRGFWMGYFAQRMAPLGPIGPAIATAVCFGFHPRRVARALPDAWQYATPDQAVTAREQGVDAALRAILGPTVDGPDMAQAADLAWTAAQAADTAGRPLAAANQALPRPAQAHVALWQATAVLREHRGDGHNAVLISRGIAPAEAHLIKAAAGEAREDALRDGRGFAAEEWDEARRGMQARGWLTAQGALTSSGHEERRAIEDRTDTAAAVPWERLGPAGTERLRGLLEPIARVVAESGMIPEPSPVGLAWSHDG